VLKVEQLAIKEVGQKISGTLIKVDGVPVEIKEKIESLVAGYVACYEVSKQLEDKKEVS